jgi:hypothetical protein
MQTEPAVTGLELPQLVAVDWSVFDPSYRLLKEAQKSWEHIISDEVVYSLQSDNVARNSFMGIAKNYIEGYAWIEAHITFEVDGRTNHACVIVEFAEGDEFLRKVGKPKTRDVFIDGNPPMLINVAEQVESPEKVALDGCLGIRSRVWLKRVNNLACFCGYSPRVITKLNGIALCEDRELGSLGIGNIDMCQHPHELIQGRAQTIQEVANDEGEHVGDVLHFNTNDVPLSFKIILTDKTYRIGFHKDADTFPQVLKVFFRPGGLQIGIS